MSILRFARLASASAALLSALIVWTAARAVDTASDSTAGARQVVVVTASEERIAGPLVEFKGGVLKLGSEPPRTIDLLSPPRLNWAFARRAGS